MRKVLWIALAFIALGGYVCWQVNGPAYAMRRAIRPGMTVAQVLDSGSGYYSCHFYSDAHPDATGDFPSFTIRSAKDSPVSLLGLSSYPEDQKDRSWPNHADFAQSAEQRIQQSGQRWRAFFWFVGTPRTLSFSVTFGPDGRVVAISKLGLSN